MNLLQKKIIEASQKYYSGEESGVSDEQFNNMLAELKKEDPDDPLLTKVGHGYDVNLDSTSGTKVKHKYGIVQSLDKIHSYSEIPEKIITENDVIASLKLDGLSVVLYYQSGKLTHALTRGSDGIGIDITAKVLKIEPTYANIQDESFTGAIRGEILMTHDEYTKYHEIHPESKNARNSAAGLINKSDSNELSYLSIIVYTIIGTESHVFDSYITILEWLKRNFRNVVMTYRMNIRSYNSDSFYNAMSELKKEWYNNLPADGIVVASNKIITSTTFEVLYFTVAYKFPDECAETEVIDVEWELSKAKNLIPVVHFKPVELEGTTVERAAGLHAQNIQENKLGPGAKIIVRKANQIIPQVTDVLYPSSESCLVPTYCPSCHWPLAWAGVHLACPNAECQDSMLQDAVVWMKELSPTDGLGDKLIQNFLIQYLGDKVSIEKIYEHGPIQASNGIQETLFVNAYNRLFTGPFKASNAIKALNIPRFGDVLADNLASDFSSVLKMLQDVEDNKVLVKISLLGNADYESLCNNLTKFKRLRFIKDAIEISTSSNNAKGKVAITGKLSVPRAQFEAELRAKGYQPTSTINKETLFLITDDPTSNTSKNQKAAQFNVRKINETDFRTFYLNE